MREGNLLNNTTANNGFAGHVNQLVLDRTASAINYKNIHAAGDLELNDGFRKKDAVLLLRLYGCYHDRIKNVVYGATPAQIIDRFFQPLQHRAYCHSTRLSLYRFVSVVASIQVWKNQYGCLAGHFRMG